MFASHRQRNACQPMQRDMSAPRSLHPSPFQNTSCCVREVSSTLPTTQGGLAAVSNVNCSHVRVHACLWVAQRSSVVRQMASRRRGSRRCTPGERRAAVASQGADVGRDLRHTFALARQVRVSGGRGYRPHPTARSSAAEPPTALPFANRVSAPHSRHDFDAQQILRRWPACRIYEATEARRPLRQSRLRRLSDRLPAAGHPPSTAAARSRSGAVEAVGVAQQPFPAPLPPGATQPRRREGSAPRAAARRRAGCAHPGAGGRGCGAARRGEVRREGTEKGRVGPRNTFSFQPPPPGTLPWVRGRLRLARPRRSDTPAMARVSPLPTDGEAYDGAEIVPSPPRLEPQPQQPSAQAPAAAVAESLRTPPMVSAEDEDEGVDAMQARGEDWPARQPNGERTDGGTPPSPPRQWLPHQPQPQPQPQPRALPSPPRFPPRHATSPQQAVSRAEPASPQQWRSVCPPHGPGSAASKVHPWPAAGGWGDAQQRDPAGSGQDGSDGLKGGPPTLLKAWLAQVRRIRKCARMEGF
eukprot:364691-Chlamydomonas_euryale.AAC.8